MMQPYEIKFAFRKGHQKTDVFRRRNSWAGTLAFGTISCTTAAALLRHSGSE